MNPTQLKTFVENNPKLVSRKESKNYPGLFVLKYTRKVFYENLWYRSPFLLFCRGLVVDSDYNIVVRPFTKIFNYMENGAGFNWFDDDHVKFSRKVNGFMAGVTLHKGGVLISTTGSLDSDFVGYAREMLSGIDPQKLRPHYTYMFEICHPSDPHIIPEQHGAHFLAVVEHDTGDHYYPFDYMTTIIYECEDHFSGIENIIYPKNDSESMTFGEFKNTVFRDVNHEGFVILNLTNDETIKIKSPYYLFKKFLARIGTDKLISGVKNGTIRNRIDEEFYPVIDSVIKFGVDNFGALEEQDRLILLRKWIGY